MEARAEDLLPVEYFHVVFTLPVEIAQIAFWNKKAVYGLLFKASAKTVMTIAADPRRMGARVGMTSVLHTWGSALTHHPHIHMIVPGGGLSPDGTKWVACQPGFFLHVRVLSRLFRRLFLEGLMDLHRHGNLAFFGDLTKLADAKAFSTWIAPFRKSEWVVYAKPPFGGAEAVLAYLSRYTHRVAISNTRLISADAQTVAFRWKDYRIKSGDRQKVMRLTTPEFIRRFLIHVLPDGFHQKPLTTNVKTTNTRIEDGVREMIVSALSDHLEWKELSCRDLAVARLAGWIKSSLFTLYGCLYIASASRQVYQSLRMTRLLLTIFLMTAASLSGFLPHAAMAAGTPESLMPCHSESTQVHDDGGYLHQCGSGDQTMSGACAIACVGPVSDWPQPFSATPIELSKVLKATPPMLILRGREIDPAARPPRSI